MLKANGKLIDTLPLKNLFSLGEHHVDTIRIEVDSIYGNLDLSDFTFVMRGITPSGTEVKKTLPKIPDEEENYLQLVWNVSRDFTSEAGTLFLDLTAYKYNQGTDPETDPPDYVFHYQLQPVEIRSIPQPAEENSP